MRMNKGQPFMDVEADFPPKDWNGKRDAPPTFSEAFLYDTVGKGDARFILGVAEEYEHVIKALGPEAVLSILQVKPALAQRLGLPALVVEHLTDARSDENLRRAQQLPSQVILDHDAAQEVWHTLHYEYRRFFDPEASMDRHQLRAYLALTEGLGPWNQEQKQKADDERPAMTERGQAANAKRQAAKEERAAKLTEARAAVEAALRGEAEPMFALGLYAATFTADE